MHFSIIIRTLNEEKYLSQLLDLIKLQKIDNHTFEIIIVDSGSNDNTLLIAKNHNCIIEKINKNDFSFGRSLNLGCKISTGDILIFISGHCLPTNDNWLINLIMPIFNKKAVYAYGKQIGNDTSKFSERMIFEKYYTNTSKLQYNDIFCNNANAALLKSQWLITQFDENLTGLEDMYLAKKLISLNLSIAYVNEACVLHLHDESWRKIKNRFEREAIALQKIMPEIQMSFYDFLRYLFSSVVFDLVAAFKNKILLKYFKEIILYRFFQYWGSYNGNKRHRILSNKIKEIYFYPH
jgi:glycosyltransferase involved in cell wall biosynthesis